MFVKYSFVCAEPEGHEGEWNRQIAFTSVNVTLEVEQGERTGEGKKLGNKAAHTAFMELIIKSGL